MVAPSNRLSPLPLAFRAPTTVATSLEREDAAAVDTYETRQHTIVGDDHGMGREMRAKAAKEKGCKFVIR